MNDSLRILFVILWSLPLQLVGQFTYLNHLIEGDNPDHQELMSNVQVIDDHIYTWGIQVVSDEVQYTIKEFDFQGNFVNQNYLVYEDAFLYIGESESFIRVEDENAFIFCQTKVSAAGYQGILVKFDDQLDTLWSRLFNFMGPETYFYTLTQSSAGYVIAGDNLVEPGHKGTFIAFIDEEGNYIDHKVIQDGSSGSYRNRNVSIISSGFIVSGSKGTAENTEGRIEFLDENGNLEWYELANDPTAIRRSTMRHQTATDGRVLVAQSIAYEDWPYNSDPLYAYFKLSLKYVDFENETFENITEYFTENEWQNAGVSEILEATDHSWVMGGSAITPTYPDSSALTSQSFIMKVDSSLTMEWYTPLFYDTCFSCFNQLYDIAATSDGGYVGVGRFQDVWASDSNEKAWMVKIDACGDIEWQGCETVSGLWDIEVAGSARPIHIWPNPVVYELNIESKPDIEWNEILITDILGQEVIRETIANSTISVGDLGTGIYVLTLFSKGLPIHSEKFIKE